MTSASTPETPDYASVKQDLDGASVDYVLQDMVNLANHIDTFSFGITLHVDGGIVSGRLIGGREYFEKMATAFLGKNETRNVFYDWMMGFRDLYPLQNEEPEGDDDKDDRRPPLYIHLRDARFVAPGSAPIPHNRGVLWRGTINSVSGWSLGLLTASEGDDKLETPETSDIE